MKRSAICGTTLLSGLFLFAGYLSWGYEVIEVSGGGVIKGEVKFVGSPPQPEPLKTTKDQDFCGDTVPDETYVIGPNQGIKNVMIAIVNNIEKGKGFAGGAKILLNNNKCRFAPRVQGMVRGQGFEIKNSDPILHNTHPYLVKQPQDRTIANLALPNQGQVIDITKRVDSAMRKEAQGVIRIKCDAHEWMRGWVHVYEHPYFAVTDDKGAFTITDVPPGSYKLRAWHEGLGEGEKEVTIPARGKVEVSFEFTEKR